MVAQPLDARRLVFVDEMGTNTSLSPLYAWAPRGQRASCSVPRNRGPNTTLLSSMTLEGMGTSLAVEGATNREVFETYVQRVLAPTLRSGQVVVMDNLSAHKGERIRQLIEERGCELIYLPSYSPDLNPIEEAFSKIKGLVRKAQARTREALLEAIGSALCAVSPVVTPVASSSTAATGCRFNHYGKRCRGGAGGALCRTARPDIDHQGPHQLPLVASGGIMLRELFSRIRY
jgi:transposase